MNKKRVFAVFIILSIVLSVGNFYMAADYYDGDIQPQDDTRAFEDNYILEKNNDGSNTYTIVGYESTIHTNMIPEKIGDKTITRIGDGAFKDSTYIIGNIIIPDTVTYIGSEAFSECTRLYGVTLGKGVKTIGDRAFYNCQTMISLNFNNKLESIGERAFSGCIQLDLQFINLPSTVTNIGTRAFDRVKTKYVRLLSLNEPTITPDSFSGCQYTNIIIPLNGDYKDTFWSNEDVMKVLYGDISNDGKVNSYDASLTIDKFKENEHTEYDLIVADLNFDDRLNSQDAASIIDAYKNNSNTKSAE